MIPPFLHQEVDDFNFDPINVSLNASVPISFSARESRRVHPYLRPEDFMRLRSKYTDLRSGGSNIRRIRKKSIQRRSSLSYDPIHVTMLPGISESGTQNYHANGETDAHFSMYYQQTTGQEPTSSSSQLLLDATTAGHSGQIDYSQVFKPLDQITYPDFNQPLTWVNQTNLSHLDNGNFYNQLNYSENTTPDPGQFAATEGWRPSAPSQPAQWQNYDHIYQTTPGPSQNFVPHTDTNYTQNGDSSQFYWPLNVFQYVEPQMHHSAQEFSFENIDPSLRPPGFENLNLHFPETLEEQELPQYSEPVLQQPQTFDFQAPFDGNEVEVAVKPDIEEQAPIKFIFESPKVKRAPRRARKSSTAGGSKNLRTSRSAQKKEAASKVTRPTRASWLAAAFAWKRAAAPRDASKVGARYLMRTKHAKTPRVYESSDSVFVRREDLPQLPCPVVGCRATCQGLKALESHLRAAVTAFKDPGHGLIVNNSKNQRKVGCLAGEDCKVPIGEGGMVRHLLEFHSNVWLYCTMCDFKMTREDQIMVHFRNEHEGERQPRQFREIVHASFQEVRGS